MSDDLQRRVAELQKQDDEIRLASALDDILSSISLLSISISGLAYMGVDTTQLGNCLVRMQQDLHRVAVENDLVEGL